MTKITIERETLKWAIRWHESRIWPGPDEVSVFDALRAALAAQQTSGVTCTMTDAPCTRNCGLACSLQMEALAAQPAEPVTHDPAIRWNFDASDTHLLVCREDHDKGDKCEYKQLHPSEVLAIVNRLRISAIELTFRSAAQPAPAAVPPGMALVPIEPTPGIITTGTVALMKASDSDLDATREEIAATYRAMIAAAGDKI